jgi:hypothetical protein
LQFLLLYIVEFIYNFNDLAFGKNHGLFKPSNTLLTNSGTELQKMQYGDYQILILPIHLPIGVNGWGGLKPYHNIVFKIDNNT